MAAKKKKTARGRKQDRARVAGGQNYEVKYESKKTGAISLGGKKGGQEGRQQPKAGGEASRTLIQLPRSAPDVRAPVL